MAGINDPGCALIFGNTGVGDCVITPKRFTGMILVPKSKVFTAVECATSTALQTAIAALVYAPQATRVFPIPGIVEFKDSAIKPGVQTLGFGDTQTIHEGKYIWEFGFLNGLMHNKRLRKFNGSKKYSVIFVDADGKYWGTKKLDATGITYGLSGVTIQEIYTYPFDLGDYSKGTAYMTKIVLQNVTELNDNPAFINMSDQLPLVGLQDVTLVYKTVATNKLTVGLVISDSLIDLYDYYSTQLADVTTFKLTKAGVTVTITACAANATQKGWDITVTGTNTGVHVAELNTSAIIHGLTVGGQFEGENTVSGTLP